MIRTARRTKTPTFAELTTAIFGEALTMDQVFTVLELQDPAPRQATAMAKVIPALWLGSIGYERYNHSTEFARRLVDAGVERLIDVRELPISRRRGYAKTALGEAMSAVGIEYVHVRALGNPKPFRDLYKSGRAAEGREHYGRFLLEERREALDDLVELLREKPSALMCVEHDPVTCHRTVIVDALRDELGLDLDVAEIV